MLTGWWQVNSFTIIKNIKRKTSIIYDFSPLPPFALLSIKLFFHSFYSSQFMWLCVQYLLFFYALCTFFNWLFVDRMNYDLNVKSDVHLSAKFFWCIPQRAIGRACCCRLTSDVHYKYYFYYYYNTFSFKIIVIIVIIAAVQLHLSLFNSIGRNGWLPTKGLGSVPRFLHFKGSFPLWLLVVGTVGSLKIIL